MDKPPKRAIMREKNERTGSGSPHRTALSCLAASLFAAVLAATAFAATPAQKSPATVQVGEMGSSAKVTLGVGDTLTVLLQANVTTGYGWQITANNKALLSPGARANLPAENNRVGASARQRLLFTAKAPGRDRLVLAYARPWEKNAAPARALTLEVTIVPASANPAAAVDPEGTQIARYTGKLPCADCSSIRQIIRFYSSGSAPHAAGYYVETMTYLNAPRGNVINITAGKWTEKRGGQSDPGETIYALSLDSSRRMQNYQLKGRSLIPLDDAMRPIQSPYDMVLRRVP